MSKFLNGAGLDRILRKIKAVWEGKADKATSATTGNLAAIDANGNIMDSGAKASDFLSSQQVANKANQIDLTTISVSSTLDDYASTYLFNFAGEPTHAVPCRVNDIEHLIVCAHHNDGYATTYMYYDFVAAWCVATYSSSNNNVPEWVTDLFFENFLGDVKSAYHKPSGGIPSTDLASAVQSLLTAAGTALQPSDITTLTSKVTALEELVATDSDSVIDKFNEIVAFLNGINASNTLSGMLGDIATQIGAKYTKPSEGIPSTDLASDVQIYLGKADTAYQKPSAGIPATDLASGVIPDISTKQDTLVSGTNIKTVNGNSLLGSGNIEIGGAVDSVNGQTGGVVLDAADVGAYELPSTGIPSTDLASAVQTSLGKADTALQPSAIANMQVTTNKVTSWQSTPDDTHYPSEKLVYDEIGNVEDVLDAVLGADTLPTQRKMGIVSAVDTTDPTDPITTLSAAVNTYYNIPVAVGTLAITLPEVTDTTHIQNIVFMLTTGSTPAVTFAAAGTGVGVIAQDGFSIEASTTYEINAIFNGVAWVVAAMKLNTTDIQPSNS